MKIKAIAAAVSLVALSGCASIVGDKDQTIAFNSTPSQAEILITDETSKKVFAGTTPTTVTLKKADGTYFGGKTYTVNISKDGFDPRTLTINSTPNGWYVAGNLLFGGLVGWLVVDPLTGAMYNLSPSEIDASLNESVAKAEDGGKLLNIVLLEDVPNYLHSELVLIGKA